MQSFPGAEYFEVQFDGGRIVLTTERIDRANIVRDKQAELGLVEEDVASAVKWLRKTMRGGKK